MPMEPFYAQTHLRDTINSEVSLPLRWCADTAVVGGWWGREVSAGPGRECVCICLSRV